MMCCPYCGHSPQGYTQYVGTSLKVNGPFYRDAYTMTAILTPPLMVRGGYFSGRTSEEGVLVYIFLVGGQVGFRMWREPHAETYTSSRFQQSQERNYIHS